MTLKKLSLFLSAFLLLACVAFLYQFLGTKAKSPRLMVDQVAEQAADQAQSFSLENKAQLEELIHEYIVENPNVIREAIEALKSQELAAMKEEGAKAVDDNLKRLFQSNSPKDVVNEPTAVLVEFFDYQCNYCKKMQGELEKVRQAHPNVQVIYKELPVLGEVSVMASQAALAAQAQDKYRPFHEALMAENNLTQQKIFDIAKKVGLDIETLKKDMQDKGIMEELAANLNLAQTLKLRGTPAFVVGVYQDEDSIRATYVPGAVPAATLIESIEKLKPSSSEEPTLQ